MTNNSVNQASALLYNCKIAVKRGCIVASFLFRPGEAMRGAAKSPLNEHRSFSGPGLRLKKLVYFLFLFAAVNGGLQAVFLRCRSVAAFEQAVEIAFVAEADLFHNLRNGQVLLLQVLFGIG
jgi:hypothetical protein